MRIFNPATQSGLSIPTIFCGGFSAGQKAQAASQAAYNDAVQAQHSQAKLRQQARMQRMQTSYEAKHQTVAFKLEHHTKAGNFGAFRIAPNVLKIEQPKPTQQLSENVGTPTISTSKPVATSAATIEKKAFEFIMAGDMCCPLNADGQTVAPYFSSKAEMFRHYAAKGFTHYIRKNKIAAIPKQYRTK